jgi:hypothetical protein
MAEDTFHLRFWLLSSWNYCESFSRGMLHVSNYHLFLLCLKLKVIMIYVFCFRSWTAYIHSDLFISAPRLEFYLICIFTEGLHSSCCLRSTSNASPECRISCWRVYGLPHNAHQNGFALVLSISLPSSLCVHAYWCVQFLISFSPFLSMLCLHEDMPINHAGFVSEHYSMVLWIILLLTKFLDGKMTVKHFLESSIGFLLL